MYVMGIKYHPLLDRYVQLNSMEVVLDDGP